MACRHLYYNYSLQSANVTGTTPNCHLAIFIGFTLDHHFDYGFQWQLVYGLTGS